MRDVSFRFFALAVLCVSIGMAWGLHMAGTHDHTFAPAHAHLNLVGWVTMALFGLYYHVTPDARGTKLAEAHFWIALVGIVLMIPGIAMTVKSGQDNAIVVIGSILTFLSMLIFLYTVLKNGIGAKA